MNIFQSILDILTTPNEMWLNIFGGFACFVEALVSMLLFTTIFNINTTAKSKIVFTVTISFFSILSKNLLPELFSLLFNILFGIVLIKYLLKTSWLKSFASTLLIIFFNAILEAILLRLFLIIFKISYQNILIIPIYKFIFSITISFFIYIFYLTIKYLKFCINLDNISNQNKTFFIILAFFGITTVIIQSYLIIYYNDTIPFSLILICSLTLTGYLIISIYSLFSASKLESTAINLEEANLYNKTLGILHDNIRNFKHNFNNIIQAIGGYINTNDFDGLNNYYLQILSDCNKSNNLTALSPDVVNNPAIYNIIATKHHYADENGIQINLGIFMDLNEFEKHIQIYQFTKILGILLDNAIEAAKECEVKQINITFRKEDQRHRILMLIENTYLNKDIDTEKIFEKSYSTKSNETNSGLGLWEIRQLLKRNNSINLFTTKNADYFIQQFEIFY